MRNELNVKVNVDYSIEYVLFLRFCLQVIK